VTTVLAARDLGRWYGPVVGLNDLTVDMGGGITGLLGPNGAGKSTLLKLVAGEIRPSRGSLEVLGHVPFGNRAYFRELGFCPQQDALYGDMTGLEFVTLLTRLHGFTRTEARRRAGRALERVHLADALDRRVRGYSKGMRQRTKLAQAIAHDPRFLVVDEPLTGLDPVARGQILTLFRELAQGGIHILISSHVLHEVETLTQEVLLLHRGRLLAQGTVAEIRRLLNRHPRKVEIEARNARALARALIESRTVSAVRMTNDDRGLALETFDIERFFQELPRIASAERAGIQRLETMDAGLEAVFDYLVT
jgi:ABC-2 type transport system ATP-binding protein